MYMLYKLYPFLRLKEYDNSVSKNIVNTYYKDRINDREFNNLDYIKKNFKHKLINQEFMKNDCFTIEYLHKKYPEDNFFQEINQKIPYHKKEFNLNFIRKKNSLPEYDEIDEKYEDTNKENEKNSSIKNSIYDKKENQDINELEKYEEIVEKKNILNYTNIFCITLTASIAYLIIKNNYL